MVNTTQSPFPATPNRARFNQLMRAGNAAFGSGKRRRAHYLWRRAAVLCPYDEQVWLALLNVLDTEPDRRVCLQNIVAVNPSNLQAQHQLDGYFDPGIIRTQSFQVQALPSESMSTLRRVLNLAVAFAVFLVVALLMTLAIWFLVYAL